MTGIVLEESAVRVLLKRSTAYFHGEVAGGSAESWAALDMRFGSVGWEKTGARKDEDIVDFV